ncbi:MAG TPA: hypothetical protein VFU05_14815 [Cyclobacteriaceae bacterium]|nr:hypothetical protein [Cyclobacteriaceae bacterium]
MNFRSNSYKQKEIIMDIVTRKLTDIQVFLKYTYSIVPIVAGTDKFFNFLTSWSEYLNPTLAGFLPFSEKIFMMTVGIIEIIAGVSVFLKPHIGAYVVCVWLVLIALTLIASGNYFDVAVRDLVMAIGAFTLAKLSSLHSASNSK